jgi:hypothetical protein
VANPPAYFFNSSTTSIYYQIASGWFEKVFNPFQFLARPPADIIGNRQPHVLRDPADGVNGRLFLYLFYD